MYVQAHDMKQIGTDTEAIYSPTSRAHGVGLLLGTEAPILTRRGIDFSFCSDMVYDQNAKGFTARVTYSCICAAECAHSTRQQAD